MRRLTAFDWRNLALPVAWLSIGLGGLPGATSGEEDSGMFLALLVVCAGLAVGSWIGRERLARVENGGWVRGMLIAVAVVAALGVFIGAARPAMLAGVLGGLAWWDLADFTQRLAAYGHPETPEHAALASAHLRRLALALGLGLLLGIAALAANISLSLEGAMALGVLAVLLIRASIGRSLR